MCPGCTGADETVNNAQPTNAASSGTPNSNTRSAAATNPVNGNTPVRPAENFANRVDQKKNAAEISGTPPPLQFQTAGEDSEFAATMNAAGAFYEVRIFKKHPKLARVEAILTGPKERELKFTLRDGQVREVKTDRISNLKLATTKELIEIGGL
jgi:hypothetical protein